MSSSKMSSSKKSESKNEGSKISERSRKIYSKLSFSEGAVPGLRKELSLEESRKFNKIVWDDWQNIYCT